MNTSKIKGFFKSFRNVGAFLLTKTFYKQVGIAFAVSLILVFLTFMLLRVFTHHGEGLSVPDFTGYTISQASKIADDSDLRLEITDSVYNAPGKKGTVIAQTPPPDFKVKKGRTIHVVIKTHNPERIEIPDFTGVSLIQAKADIETYGLKIGKLKYVPDIATNNVLEQMYEGKPIAPGTKIEKNSKIDLVLGMGENSKSVKVPGLLGKNKSEATKLLTDNSLNVGVEMYDETVLTEQDTLNAVVWKQSPVEKRFASMGASIDLWFTMDSTKTIEDYEENLEEIDDEIGDE